MAVAVSMKWPGDKVATQRDTVLLESRVRKIGERGFQPGVRHLEACWRRTGRDDHHDYARPPMIAAPPTAGRARGHTSATSPRQHRNAPSLTTTVRAMPRGSRLGASRADTTR